jgi:hypothetical protein
MSQSHALEFAHDNGYFRMNLERGPQSMRTYRKDWQAWLEECLLRVNPSCGLR